MSNKEAVLEMIQKLPDDVSMDDICEKLAFIAAVQEGIDAADRGETESLESVEQELKCRLK